MLKSNERLTITPGFYKMPDQYYISTNNNNGQPAPNSETITISKETRGLRPGNKTNATTAG